MTLSWAYIESVLFKRAPIYKLCPRQGAHLTWIISWSLGEAGALRTQTEGWGRLRWSRWAIWVGCLEEEALEKLASQA